tara:strand:- start:813 stop:965 length:153 start_codon:yes stop_codon:yes gene_type:complete
MSGVVGFFSESVTGHLFFTIFNKYWFGKSWGHQTFRKQKLFLASFLLNKL